MFEKLITISRNKELGRILIDAEFNNDHILKVKTFSKSVYCVVKYMKIPPSYSLTIWDLTNGRFTDQFEFHECSGNESISLWSVTKELVACVIEKDVYVYDISNDYVKDWKLHYKFSHEKEINCISLNDEMGYSSNILVSADSEKLKIWSVHSKECLHVIKHGSICDVSLIAVGGICTVLDIHSNDIYMYSTSSGKLERKIEIENKSNTKGRKQISHEKNKISYFLMGDCEYTIFQFGGQKTYGYRVKKSKRTSECILL